MTLDSGPLAVLLSALMMVTAVLAAIVIRVALERPLTALLRRAIFGSRVPVDAE